jgi:inorganic pyrophosphatase
MECTVFIEAEAGSCVKGVYDERSLARTGERRTLAPYPYAYGIIPDTQGGPEDECLDCYLISRCPLSAGRLRGA